MDRGIKHRNDLCFRKEIQLRFRSYEAHCQRMKACIDNSQPRSLKPSDAKAKMILFEKRRNMLAENSSLVNRLSEVKEGSRYIELVPLDYKPAKSLNSKMQKYTQYSIKAENAHLRQRMLKKVSHYRVKEFQRERKQVEENIRLISRYQYKDFKPSKTHVNFYFRQAWPQRHTSKGSQHTSCLYKEAIRLNSEYYYAELGKEGDGYSICVDRIQKREGEQRKRLRVDAEVLQGRAYHQILKRLSLDEGTLVLDSEEKVASSAQVTH